MTIDGDTITDSLGRTITITHESGYTAIHYVGFGGVAKTIKVWTDLLENRLRPNSGYSIQTLQALFNLNNSSSPFNPGRVSRVELPNDGQAAGRTYEFYYNPYGELARVVLPTGGAYEYDWGGGSDSQQEVIFRYVTKRRVYSAAAGIPEQEVQYVRELGSGFVEIKTFSGASATLLAYSKHYFYGDAVESMVGHPELPGAVSFSPWRGAGIQDRNFRRR